MAKEADIIINGVRLTTAQSMTVRVAISSMIMDMAHGDELGKDALGEEIRKLYLERSREVANIILSKEK